MSLDQLLEILNSENEPVSVECETLEKAGISIEEICARSGRSWAKETIVVRAEQPGIMPIPSEMIRFEKKGDV